MVRKKEAPTGSVKLATKPASKAAKKPTDKQSKGVDKSGGGISSSVAKRTTIEITVEMKASAVESKKLIKDGCTKAEVARGVFANLKCLERRQVIWVFIEGCGLSRAGAGTYYQNCKNK